MARWCRSWCVTASETRPSENDRPQKLPALHDEFVVAACGPQQKALRRTTQRALLPAAQTADCSSMMIRQLVISRSASCSPQTRRGLPPGAAAPARRLGVRHDLQPDRSAVPPSDTPSPRRIDAATAPAPPTAELPGARRHGEHSRPSIPARQPAGPRGRALGSSSITSSH